MSNVPLRSPSDTVGGLVYFGRMLDKIRLHERGELPEDYQPNLGKGFDRYCTEYLGVNYADVVVQVRSGDSDEQVLAWCREAGKPRSETELKMWNEFMRKLGWNDDVTPTLERRKAESGFADRTDIQTMFDYIDADEGRPLRT